MVIRSRQPDVAGGDLHFTYHPVTGDLYYQGAISFIGAFKLRRKKLFSGSIKLDPAALKSARAKVGDTFHVAGVEAVVRVIEHERAWVRFHAPGLGHAQGVAMLDLTEEQVKLTIITGGFSYRGLWRGMEVVDGGDPDPEHR